MKTVLFVLAGLLGLLVLLLLTAVVRTLLMPKKPLPTSLRRTSKRPWLWPKSFLKWCR